MKNLKELDYDALMSRIMDGEEYDLDAMKEYFDRCCINYDDATIDEMFDLICALNNRQKRTKTMKKTIDYTALADTIRAGLNARHDRSAWDKAVTLYAFDLLDDVQEGADNMERLPLDGAELEQWALNGASCWEQYSNGGCSLCYNADIAARVCTPSELKRTDGGMNAPNSRETWLDVQARALYQACNRIRTICHTNGLYCKGVQ